MARRIKDNKGSQDGQTVGTIGQGTIGFLFEYQDEFQAEGIASNLQVAGFDAETYGTIVKLAKIEALDNDRLNLADTITQRSSLASYRTIMTIDRPGLQRVIDLLRKSWTESAPRMAAGYQDPMSSIGSLDLFDLMARDKQAGEHAQAAVKVAGWRVSTDLRQIASVYHWTSSDTAADSIRRLLRSDPDLDVDTRSIVRDTADRFEVADRPAPPLAVAAAEHASDTDYSIAAPSTREQRSGSWTGILDRLARACVGSDLSGTVGDTGHGDGSMQRERGGYTSTGNPVAGEKQNRQCGKRIGKGSGGNARAENSPAILAYRATYRPICKRTIGPFFRRAVDALHPSVRAENHRRGQLRK